MAASVVSKRHEELRRRWRLEGGVPRGGFTPDAAWPLERLRWPKEGFVPRETGDVRCSLVEPEAFQGTFVVLDLDTGQVVWQAPWDGYVATPSGFAFADGQLYVNDLEGAAVAVFALPHLEQPHRVIRNGAFNDLHGIRRTRRGLLVACSGTDAVVEVDLQGQSLWEWWAAEHGLTRTPSGYERASGRGQDHRGMYYHTRYQATHVNDAVYRDPEETKVLALLFHQGWLVEFSPNHGNGSFRVVMDGLVHAHALRPLPDGGFSLANSQGKEILLLDESLRVRERIPSVEGWIQDAVLLGDGRLLVLDVDHHRLVLQGGPGWEVAGEVTYDSSWRLYQVEEVPEWAAPAFRPGQSA